MPRNYKLKSGIKRRCGSHPKLEEAKEAIELGEIYNIFIKSFQHLVLVFVV